jgi:hypothetical protein
MALEVPKIVLVIDRRKAIGRKITCKFWMLFKLGRLIETTEIHMVGVGFRSIVLGSITSQI